MNGNDIGDKYPVLLVDLAQMTEHDRAAKILRLPITSNPEPMDVSCVTEGHGKESADLNLLTMQAL